MSRDFLSPAVQGRWAQSGNGHVLSRSKPGGVQALPSHSVVRYYLQRLAKGLKGFPLLEKLD